jgi:ribosomal protein S18 acetylase RimI-like enzyme
MLKIRPFSDLDTEPVIALWQTCNLIVSHNDPMKDIQFCKSTSTAELFVGDIDGEIVTTVMTGHDGHRGWLYYLAVDPKFGKRGFGRTMVRHAEVWLKDLGVPKINLMIRDTNEEVRAFYEAIGYATEPRLVMARFLTDD